MTMLGRIARPGRRGPVVAGIAGVVLALTAAPASLAAQSTEERPRPERALAMYTAYSRVQVPAGETLRMDLTIENKGRRDEDVSLALARVPEGWTASLRSGAFDVRGVPVGGDKSRVLTFTAEPKKGLPPGTYTFEIRGETADGFFRETRTVVVTTEERKGPAAGELQISTSYPVLRGPTDSAFEFSLEVSNRSDADRIVNVAAEAPRGWEVNLKPAYETKQITSLRIRAGSSQTVALELKPPRDAQAGEYPVTFRASTDKAQAEAKLRVHLTGIYKLDAATPTGRLSLDAVVGKPSTTTVVVRNTGSAVNRNISLSSFQPENWKVEFEPERIEALEPGAFQQVTARITPAAQALVGDYSVALMASGERASKTLEMRVQVHAPNTWAWIGVGVIAAVIGGLGGLFAWLGRR
jgi:uncharacterized membrane protein